MSPRRPRTHQSYWPPEGKVIVSVSWTIDTGTAGWENVSCIGIFPDGLAGRRWAIVLRNTDTIDHTASIALVCANA